MLICVFNLYRTMIWSLLTVLFLCGVCDSEDGDLGYSLHIGNAIDVFANYGDLSQVTQVVSADYEEEEQEPIEPFREKNIRVFVNVTSTETIGNPIEDISIQLCETVDDLLMTYFQNFKIEGTDKPWKAFMGDWIIDEVMRTFGIDYNSRQDDCCYALVKMAKTHRSVKLDDLTDVAVKSYVKIAVETLNMSNANDVRRFMKSYGTHYIDSFTTGNFVYQVFKYKRTGFNRMRSYVRMRKARHMPRDNLRYYFSSYFLQQIGEIRIASGNKTVESWARLNLRDSQYLYSRPSLLRLHYSPILAYKLNDLLDHGALLGMDLKTLKPVFRDTNKADKYAEIVENDLKLWEVNA